MYVKNILIFILSHLIFGSECVQLVINNLTGRVRQVSVEKPRPPIVVSL